MRNEPTTSVVQTNERMSLANEQPTDRMTEQEGEKGEIRDTRRNLGLQSTIEQSTTTLHTVPGTVYCIPR